MTDGPITKWTSINIR